MVVFENFFAALANVIHLVLMLYMYMVIARAIVSWFSVNPHNQVIQFLVRTTEPPLAWIRKHVPPFSGLDLSPVLLILAIIFVDRFLVGILGDF